MANRKRPEPEEIDLDAPYENPVPFDELVKRLVSTKPKEPVSKKSGKSKKKR